MSALLGVVTGFIIGVQSTFKLPEKAVFQRRIASQAHALVEELVFNVNNDLRFLRVLRHYQQLSARAVEDFPTDRRLEAIDLTARDSGIGAQAAARRE